MADEVKKLSCSNCGSKTEHKKMTYKGKTIWKCQECYSIDVVPSRRVKARAAQRAVR